MKTLPFYAQFFIGFVFGVIWARCIIKKLNGPGRQKKQ
jgi:cytochrome c biogenesis protein CcdA